jgi:hypothetical protein
MINGELDETGTTLFFTLYTDDIDSFVILPILVRRSRNG